MARDLSTKGLARRLHAEYAAYRPFRQKLFAASAACVVIAAVVVAALWLAGKPKQREDLMYQPGTVHGVHQASVATCTQCHVPGKSAPEAKCKACHDSPEHNLTQQKLLAGGGLPKPPACAECHLEHRGGTRAEPPKDSRCVSCHAQLSKSDAKPAVANSITSFDSNHPEFAKVAKPGQDLAKVMFNHRFHLDPEFRKAKIGVVSDNWGKMVEKFLAAEKIARQEDSATAKGELACTDCHKPDAAGKLMSPVSFEKHCRSCHNLDFDLETRGDHPARPKPIPHVEAAEIHKHLVAEFTAEHHALLEATANNTDSRASLADRYPKTAAKYATQWVSSRVDSVERGLLGAGRCTQCHVASDDKKESGGFTQVLAMQKTNILSNWYPHARFNHFLHRAMKCDSCHRTARQSSDTSDVNLPTITDCRGCHSQAGGARADCSECHLYHDKQIRALDEGRIEKLPGTGK